MNRRHLRQRVWEHRIRGCGRGWKGKGWVEQNFCSVSPAPGQTSVEYKWIWPLLYLDANAPWSSMILHCLRSPRQWGCWQELWEESVGYEEGTIWVMWHTDETRWDQTDTMKRWENMFKGQVDMVLWCLIRWLLVLQCAFLFWGPILVTQLLHCLLTRMNRQVMQSAGVHRMLPVDARKSLLFGVVVFLVSEEFTIANF